MPTPVHSDLLLCLCQFPALRLVHFHSLPICAQRLQSILNTGTKWCGSWGSPLEPKLWVGIQTCLITPETEEPPGRAHVLKEEEAKHNKLEPKTKTRSSEGRDPLSPVLSPGPCLESRGQWGGMGWRERRGRGAIGKSWSICFKLFKSQTLYLSHMLSFLTLLEGSRHQHKCKQ